MHSVLAVDAVSACHRCIQFWTSMHSVLAIDASVFFTPAHWGWKEISGEFAPPQPDPSENSPATYGENFGFEGGILNFRQI